MNGQDRIRLTLDETTFGIRIENGRTQWHTLDEFRPCLAFGGKNGVGGVKDVEKYVLFSEAGKITSEPYRTGFGSGVRLTLSDFPVPAEGMAFELLVWVEKVTQTVRCEWIPVSEPDYHALPLTAVYWPGPMKFEEARSDWYTLVNYEQGIRIPNNWPVATSKCAFAGFLGTAGAYMPWFAQVKEGQGLLSICETPWNAAFDIDHPENGPYTHMSVHWEPSLGSMRERRILRMELVEGDHNDVCKAYRRYAEETGRLVTLKEKAVRQPSIYQMIGSCFVHTGIKTKVQPNSDFFDPENPGKNDHLTTFASREAQIKAIHEAGVSKLYLHLDGWADPGYDNNHPDYFPIGKEAGGRDGMKSLADTVRGLGYMFGIHDQYRDFYESAESFSEDLACRLPDGSIPRHRRWAGGPQSYLCASQAPYFVRRNFEHLLAEGIELDGAYLDVFTCNEGDECDNPRHRMTRQDCQRYREECFRYLLSKNILPSSEEVNDWAMRSLVFCHYAPYDFMLAEPGSPKRGIPVPLFNLVYHDCVVEPWMMDKVSESEDYMLYALENGGAPYLIRDAAYPNIDGAFEGIPVSLLEAAERCRTVQDLHEKVGMAEMLRCEFLADDGHIQRTVFEGGVSVTVDFEKQCFVIECGDEKDVK